ncbi:MAG: glutamine--tRNA ligase/YqeY domain fusion protein [Proteobacteria bacterium]|nr:glutamine--tRNA ligase/YqeY domain fusion protein [Pseudomonadota bacterium]
MIESASSSSNFLRDLIETDLAAGRYDRVVTRFPPEPNGYLHIGHAKAICANFGLAAQFGGVCTLRMDDTNPTKEDIEYVESIQDDIRWLGFDWGEHFFHAADYFEQLYRYARELISKDLAYVCSQTNEEMRRDRGTVIEAGTASPDRDRPTAESLDLFARMRAGEFADGELTLRAKIDMAASNMKLRDPPMYRIRHATHHRTGDDWPIYPIYDFAHGLSDSVEGITHSFCTLEFQNNRALYDWYIENTSTLRPRPYQYEFARLVLSWTLTSKRKLLQLVTEDHVQGWDDPRMPTISGLRRRGVPPAAIRNFCDRIGVSKTNSIIEMEVFEEEIRAELNRTAPRRMVVRDPVRLVLVDWPEGTVDPLELANHPSADLGTRTVPLAGQVFVERSDFSDDPPKGWKRLSVGVEVRLRGAYLVTVNEVLRDEDGRILELHATHDHASRGGDAPDGRKVRGTIHWVPTEPSVTMNLRMVDRLFAVANPGEGDADFLDELNPASMPITEAVGEGALRDAAPGDAFQFERIGYFAVDADSTAEALVFNRAVSLRDTWAKASTAPTKGKSKARSAPVVAAATPSAEELAALAAWTEVGVSVETARMLKADAALDTLAWDAVLAGAEAKDAANLVGNELVRALDGRGTDALPFGGDAIASLASLSADGTLNQRGLRAVLAELVMSGGAPGEIVERLSLVQLSSDALTPVITAVLADHPEEAARLAGGETKLIGFLLGQVMRRTGGKADPKAARALLMQSVAGTRPSTAGKAGP